MPRLRDIFKTWGYDSFSLGGLGGGRKPDMEEGDNLTGIFVLFHG